MAAIWENLDLYWQGFIMTLRLLVISGIGAFALGFVVTLLRISPIASLRAVGAAYTELVRNIPLTLVFFFVIIVLPTVAPAFDPMTGAYVSLAVYTSPFVSEALRSGINGVPMGQAEAARSLGLRFGQVVFLIIIPQAIRTVIPPMINVVIALTKNTSVAGGFYIVELFAISKTLANENGNHVIAILLGIAVCYLIITVPLGQLAGRIERRVAVTR